MTEPMVRVIAFFEGNKGYFTEKEMIDGMMVHPHATNEQNDLKEALKKLVESFDIEELPGNPNIYTFSPRGFTKINKIQESIDFLQKVTKIV